jgi:hypothetical protein
MDGIGDCNPRHHRIPCSGYPGISSVAPRLVEWLLLPGRRQPTVARPSRGDEAWAYQRRGMRPAR